MSVLVATEAAEAAADLGRFWEMHDLLMDNQTSLIYLDLMRYAADLGLDVDRFGKDLPSRRHAARIHRDIDSADASGAVGTPTMFVNGRRHRAPTTSTPSPPPSSASWPPTCEAGRQPGASGSAHPAACSAPARTAVALTSPRWSGRSSSSIPAGLSPAWGATSTRAAGPARRRGRPPSRRTSGGRAPGPTCRPP
jgi:hypothetical protein